MRGYVDTNWLLESFWGQDATAGTVVGVQMGEGYCRLSQVGRRERYSLRVRCLGVTAGLSAELPNWLRRRLPLSSYDFSTADMPGGGIGRIQRSPWGPEPRSITDFAGPCLFTTVQVAAIAGVTFGVLEFNADGGARKPVVFYTSSAGVQAGGGLSLLFGDATVI